MLVPNLALGLPGRLTLAVYVPYFVNADVRVSSFKVGGQRGTALAQDALRAMGYKNSTGGAPVSDWSSGGLGDVQAGLRWRAWERGPWSAAATVAARLPTGTTDDPDLLTDFGLGAGDVAVQGWLGVDRELGTRGRCDLTLSYQAQLPAHLYVRPFGGHTEYASFDLGDIFSAELEGRFLLSGWIPLALVYRFADKFADGYQGQQDLSSLSEGTSGTSHTLGARAGFSTVDAFQKKRFVYPFARRASVLKTFSQNSDFENLEVELLLDLYF